MFSFHQLPTLTTWCRDRGPQWRLVTWWPSDSLGAMQRSLLHLVIVANRERLDLVPLVENLAEEHRGFYRRRLRRFAAIMREGGSLIDALEQTPDVLTDESVLAIRFATQTGTLTPTLGYLIDNAKIPSGITRTKLRQTVVCSVLTSLVLLGTISFLMTFLLPIFQEMRKDFGMGGSSDTFPWAFDALVAMCDHLSDFAGFWILLILAIAWLVWSTHSRRFFRRTFAARWSRGTAEFRIGDILDLLSLVVQAGRPVPAAISTLARYHFDQTMRHKLLSVGNEIERGTDTWRGLADAELITLAESRALANSSSSESRSWALRQLAKRRKRSSTHRTDNLASFAQPAITVALATIVLLVASAVIGFLSHLIQSLS